MISIFKLKTMVYGSEIGETIASLSDVEAIAILFQFTQITCDPFGFGYIPLYLVSGTQSQ